MPGKIPYLAENSTDSIQKRLQNRASSLELVQIFQPKWK